ncbi:hypothetical protein EVAR_65037_1 [Eumeta japonica]|uniref:Uncharacterized protein n=1 Tax=Eumeta variegata TaxID=151549 RepID=A0A4C1YVB6_EUMVA|nr:hypothetical protein EVAR_65037_1 [Eumeta japonica]
MFSEFDCGQSMLTDEFKEGYPKSVVTLQNIDAVRELMMSAAVAAQGGQDAGGRGADVRYLLLPCAPALCSKDITLYYITLYLATLHDMTRYATPRYAKPRRATPCRTALNIHDFNLKDEQELLYLKLAISRDSTPVDLEWTSFFIPTNHAAHDDSYFGLAFNFNSVLNIDTGSTFATFMQAKSRRKERKIEWTFAYMNKRARTSRYEEAVRLCRYRACMLKKLAPYEAVSRNGD